MGTDGGEGEEMDQSVTPAGAVSGHAYAQVEERELIKAMTW